MAYTVIVDRADVPIPFGEDKVAAKKKADEKVGTRVYKDSVLVYISGIDTDFNEPSTAG